MEMGMPSHKSTMVIDEDDRRGTVLDVNNPAAKSFVATQEEERRREEERFKREQEKSDLPTSWFTDFVYEPEGRYF